MPPKEDGQLKKPLPEAVFAGISPGVKSRRGRARGGRTASVRGHAVSVIPYRCRHPRWAGLAFEACGLRRTAEDWVFLEDRVTGFREESFLCGLRAGAGGLGGGAAL